MGKNLEFGKGGDKSDKDAKNVERAIYSAVAGISNESKNYKNVRTSRNFPASALYFYLLERTHNNTKNMSVCHNGRPPTEMKCDCVTCSGHI